jgi:osmoprotectant transport system substrate-binding protein
VGSGNFPESTLLGEVYAQALEAKGIKVVRRFNIGSREVYYDQLKSGSVAVMPEYNGALASFLNESADTTSTARAASELRNRLPPQLDALTPSKAEDKDSVTVNRKTADLYHLRTIEDLRPVQSQIIMGASDEFRTRLQGLVGLRGAYGLNRLGFVAFRTDDREHMIEQLKQDSIQAADLFTTESAIDSDHFVVLSDPKHVFGVQNITPVVYRSALTPAARAALNTVSAHLTTEDLRFMNMRVSVNQVDATAVAKDWLQRTGLIR